MKSFTLSSLLKRAEVTTEPYRFEDGEKVVNFPTDIADLGRQARELNNMLVEVQGEIAKHVNDYNQIAAHLNKTRERIAAWARDHGVKADAVTEEPLP